MKSQYKILKALDHPNISKAFYLFINEDNKELHLVTELF